MITKYVQSNHYHIWTDAIHARQLAKQTKNRWDRGTYVRWTILTSWIALEIACQDALDENTISYSFKKNIDGALVSKGHPPLDWSRGIWQNVLTIQNLRKDIVHRFQSETQLFPDIAQAELAISSVRAAVIDIYRHCQKHVPSWIDDDHDEGWTTGTFQMFGSGHNAKYENVEGSIKVTYVYKDNEHIFDYFPPETDIDQPIENIFPGIGKPITAVRLYKGHELVTEYIYDKDKVRGA